MFTDGAGMNFSTVSGFWKAADNSPVKSGQQALRQALFQLNRPIYVMAGDEGGAAVAAAGTIRLGDGLQPGEKERALQAYVPPLLPENLGDAGFKELTGVRYPYVAGAMANGITSVEMVAAAADAGMIGFFGAAGLSPAEVEKAVDELQSRLERQPFGVNLIHSPGDQNLEREIVNLYLKKKVTLISASAFMRMTPSLVLYRVRGIHADGDGRVVIPNKVVAKVSRVEVASKFFSPPPEKILSQLSNEGAITGEEAALAERIPMADAVTAEADSGGHTDNRPALALLPTMIALRDSICADRGYERTISIGLGGGIATPESAAAAFAMGAGYVVTGSVNQACRESGVTDEVRAMLADAGQADVTMAPAADMFEMGGKVQVLKRGTMFAMRATKLYDLYTRYNRFEELPEKERANIEKSILRRSFEEEWQATRRFFEQRDPRQVEKAEKDPRHKMALVFRSYLGRSSMWGITGEADRKMDYQIWCGPSMGAFNEWVRGSFLEKAENRDVATVAMNLLYGAAVVTRAGWLRCQNIAVAPETAKMSPMSVEDIAANMQP